MSDLCISVKGACGRLTLDRPKAMNALTLDMILAMRQALDAWRTNPAVAFVVVDGVGDRGLCAGGDIRALYEVARSGELEPAATFFREEYRLNSLIAHYPKPYIALMDGVVMGGGIGISAYGTWRIVTERSNLAMPETGIGFIPDVGGTYLLGNAPGELGTYLALTAGRMSAADAIDVGLADIFVLSAQLKGLTEELERSRSGSEAEQCLRSRGGIAPAGTLRTSAAWINACFAGNSAEAILKSLLANPEPAAHQAAAELQAKSPTAVKVTLRALRHARSESDLNGALRQEFRLAMNCLRHPDFVEGVRAAVVDKDRKPRWEPAKLEDVTAAQVDSFFSNGSYGELQLSENETREGASTWQ